MSHTAKEYHELETKYEKLVRYIRSQYDFHVYHDNGKDDWARGCVTTLKEAKNYINELEGDEE